MRRRTSQRRFTGRALLASVAVGAAIAASGCASGQIAQTAEEQPGVPGAEGSVGAIQLHNVAVAYPASGVYDVGSTARLTFVIVNDGDRGDRLVSVSSGSAKVVRIDGDGDAIKVGPQANVNVYGDGPKVVLTNLVRQLRSSEQTSVTFRFAKAGEVTIQTPVAPASKVLPKETLKPKG